LRDVGLTRIVVTTTVIRTPEQAHLRGFTGSRTVLINGRDPFAEPGRVPGLACRMYANRAGRAVSRTFGCFGRL
jgi:hypothetical protein